MGCAFSTSARTGERCSSSRTCPAWAGKLALMPLPAWREGGLRTSTWGGTGLAFTKDLPELGPRVEAGDVSLLRPDTTRPALSQDEHPPAAEGSLDPAGIHRAAALLQQSTNRQALHRDCAQVPEETVTAYLKDGDATSSWKPIAAPRFTTTSMAKTGCMTMCESELKHMRRSGAHVDSSQRLSEQIERGIAGMTSQPMSNQPSLHAVAERSRRRGFPRNDRLRAAVAAETSAALVALALPSPLFHHHRHVLRAAPGSRNGAVVLSNQRHQEPGICRAG